MRVILHAFERLPGRLILLLLLLGTVLLGLRQQSFAGRILVNTALVYVNSIPLSLRDLSSEEIRQANSAERFLLEAIAIEPEMNSAWRGLGVALLLQGRQDEAIDAWEQIDLDPTWMLSQYGSLAAYDNEYDDALLWYQRTASLYPDLTGIWHQLGLIRQRKGHLSEAAAAFRQSWDRDWVESATPLARLLEASGANADAIAVWQEALERYPVSEHRLEWWRGLDASLRAGRHWGAALDSAQLALEEFPDDAALLAGLATSVYWSRQDFDAAVTLLHRAIELDGHLAFSYATMGGMMASERRYAEAIAWYSEAIDLNPANGSLYVARANAIRELGDLPLALEHYQEAADLFADSAEVQYQLAWAYRLSDLPLEASEAIDKALAMSDIPVVKYLVRAGAVYEWIGDTERALAFYHDVLRIDANNEAALNGIVRLEG